MRERETILDRVRLKYTKLTEKPLVQHFFEVMKHHMSHARVPLGCPKFLCYKLILKTKGAFFILHFHRETISFCCPPFFTLFEIFIFVQKFNFDFLRKIVELFWVKTREKATVLDFLAVDNFDFTRKIVKKFFG